MDIATAFPPPYHFGNHITLKVTSDNYIFWRAQVLPLLRSHYLLGYVDDTLPCPPALVDGVHGLVINPAHRVWTAQDQANLSSIQGSLSPGVADLVVFAKTSHEAWTILETTFSAQSQARANPITDAEFTSYIVNGLDEEYDGLVEVVNERANTSPMPPHELYQRLLQTEQLVEARPGRQEASGHLGDFAAHVANRGGSHPPPSAPYSPSGKTASPPPAPDHSGGGRSKRVYQLCGQEGHIAAKCHRRFQRCFLGLGNDGKDTRNNARQPAMADRPAPPPSQGQTQTYVYMDTGATDHLTSELGKMHTRDVYTGSDKVHTANGAGSTLASESRCCAALHSFTNNLHVAFISYWFDNLGFLLRENSLLYSSYVCFTVTSSYFSGAVTPQGFITPTSTTRQQRLSQGTGRGARLELLDDATPSSPSPNFDRVASHGLDKRDHARSASDVDHAASSHGLDARAHAHAPSAHVDRPASPVHGLDASAHARLDHDDDVASSPVSASHAPTSPRGHRRLPSLACTLDTTRTLACAGVALCAVSCAHPFTGFFVTDH
ncbi:hypothetical protein QYE76_061246 [Lolium multiflorum]|uniref:Retrotransposon Copia-like N-terminal domain-containing protein n=1 Tax=Lolium multiflorum TaxID=4521 RepID=A0AAD8W4I0_LOLMU|nr:hypothetical protein QYE76_061246 [Lolium multiflorum]